MRHSTPTGSLSPHMRKSVWTTLGVVQEAALWVQEWSERGGHVSNCLEGKKTPVNIHRTGDINLISLSFKLTGLHYQKENKHQNIWWRLWRKLVVLFGTKFHPEGMAIENTYRYG